MRPDNRTPEQKLVDDILRLDLQIADLREAHKGLPLMELRAANMKAELVLMRKC